MASFRMTRPFAEARAVLGVSDGAGADEVRRAYRRAVAAAPPDRDANAFRRVREAYELLSDPIARAEKILLHPVPHEPPPPLPPVATQADTESLPLAVLRAVVGRLPADKLLRPEPGRAADSKAGKE